MPTVAFERLDTQAVTLEALAKRIRQAIRNGHHVWHCFKVVAYLIAFKRVLKGIERTVNSGPLDSVSIEQVKDIARHLGRSVQVFDGVIAACEGRRLALHERSVLRQVKRLRDPMEDLTETLALGADVDFQEEIRAAISILPKPAGGDANWRKALAEM